MTWNSAALSWLGSQVLYKGSARCYLVFQPFLEPCQKPLQLCQGHLQPQQAVHQPPLPSMPRCVLCWRGHSDCSLGLCTSCC